MVVDTSVLAAGISGFRGPFVQGRNPGADVLHRWAEKNDFVWLVTEDILDEYKEVLKRLRVRSNLIGRVVNLIRERAEEIRVHPLLEISPDPGDDSFHFPRFCGALLHLALRFRDRWNADRPSAYTQRIGPADPLIVTPKFCSKWKD